MIGSEFEYTAQRGDYLTKIGARFGIEQRVLARMNDLKWSAALKPGQVLRIDNRHIVPKQQEEGIIINLPQRMLYFFRQGELAFFYPVGLGRPDWQTPVGRFKVANLQENKTWYVPKSIQEEMRREGKAVLTEVPPGPENPLGKHWIGLNFDGYGIHGTIAPASIYHFQSHGCIRSHPDDIARLFPQLSIGQPVNIIYAPVLLTRIEDGRIFLEAHRDVYKKGGDPLKTVQDAAQSQGLAGMMDWEKVEEVIRKKEGLAREVGQPVNVIPNGGIQ
ncbi:MAG: L,D-transpeptidase family protein [Gammaproteobacteria bacterium]|nr:L,D-transpeptidase family protein [Gammaproteobacteria bacterium]